MEILDTVDSKETAAAAAGPESHVSLDRFEVTRRFEEREEEEMVEAAMALYEKAARARMPASVPDVTVQASEEELEAMSQELKLRQKCQDIAAMIMVDERDLLDSGAEEDD